jgi:dihydrofolate reductase
MGRVTYSMNVSLDGYTNAPDGSLEWIRIDEEVHRWFNDRAREADAFVYGRRMWETMAAYWPTAEADAGDSPAVLDFAGIWNRTPKIVFSATLPSVEHGARLVRGDVADALDDLRRQFPGELDVGGATLAAALVRRNLIDEYRLVVHPVILGAGTPFFPPLEAAVRLRLVETGRFGSGATLSIYRPA